jgi:hypothetical protein
MNTLIGWGLRKGWREGVINGKRAWLVTGGVALVLRVIHRAVTRGEPKVVYREQLKPGETLIVAHQQPS